MRNTSLLKILWRKYRKIIIGFNLILLVTAYPLYEGSKMLHAAFFVQLPYAPKLVINSSESVDIEVNANFEKNTFRNLILSEIKQAQDSIYIAIYSFNIEEIKDALIDAQNRGVKVKIFHDFSNREHFEEFVTPEKSLLDYVYVGENIESTNYSMHHKFMLVDPESDNPTLLAGSWNWSYLQEDLDPNILLKIKNKDIIDAYYAEANRLEQGYNGHNKFKDSSYNPWYADINFSNDSRAEVWFSPGLSQNSIQSRALDLINDATSTIDIGMTIMDSLYIADTLVKKAEEGVKVRLIVDWMSMDMEDSRYQYLKNIIKERGLYNFELLTGGEEIANEKGQYSIFHHHNMVVDKKIVYTSTANWTYGGFFLNDEDTLIVHDKKLANEFTEIFEKYRGRALEVAP